MAGKGFISIKVFGDTKQYERSMGKAKGITMKFGSSVKSLLGVAGIAGVGAGMVSLTKKAVSAAASLETMETSLKAMTGSAKLAKEVMSDLTDFTAKTPFQLEEVAGAARQLMAAGVETRHLQRELQKLGDLAAVTNVPLNEMAQIYSKAMNKGKLQAEELNQLSERGIPIMRELADMYGVTKNEIFDMASKGKIGFNDLTKAMERMTSEGGIAHEAMKNLSETSAGLYSTFKDNLNLTLAKLGEKILPVVNKMLKEMNDQLSGPGTGSDRIRELRFEIEAAEEAIKAHKEQLGFGDKAMKGLNQQSYAVQRYNQKLLALQLNLAKLKQEQQKLQRDYDPLKEGTENITEATESAAKATLKQSEAVKELTTAYHGLAIKAMEVEGLELMSVSDDENVQMSAQQDMMRERNKLLGDYIDGIGMAGDGISNLNQLYGNALGEEAKNRKAIATFQALLAVPQATLLGLTQGGPPLAAIYGALAGLEAAAIASTPMPSFAIGTTSFAGGPAILHPNETITNLPTGTKVVSKGMSGGGGVVVLDTKFDGRDLYLVQNRESKVQNYFRPS